MPHISTKHLDIMMLDVINSPSAESKMPFLIDDSPSSQNILSPQAYMVKQIIVDPTSPSSEQFTETDAKSPD